MIDIIAEILVGVLQALPDKSPRAKPHPPKPSWAGLPVGLFCAAGAAGSVYWMFFQNGELWQIAKLLLLTFILAFLAWMGLNSFVAGRRLERAQRRAASGRCPRCGYDVAHHLTATCPECCHAVSRAAARNIAPATRASLPICATSEHK